MDPVRPGEGIRLSPDEAFRLEAARRRLVGRRSDPLPYMRRRAEGWSRLQRGELASRSIDSWPLLVRAGGEGDPVERRRRRELVERVRDDPLRDHLRARRRTSTAPARRPRSSGTGPTPPNTASGSPLDARRHAWSRSSTLGTDVTWYPHSRSWAGLAPSSEVFASLQLPERLSNRSRTSRRPRGSPDPTGTRCPSGAVRGVVDRAVEERSPDTRAEELAVRDATSSSSIPISARSSRIARACSGITPFIHDERPDVPAYRRIATAVACPIVGGGSHLLPGRLGIIGVRIECPQEPSLEGVGRHVRRDLAPAYDRTDRRAAPRASRRVPPCRSLEPPHGGRGRRRTAERRGSSSPSRRSLLGCTNSRPSNAGSSRYRAT